MKNIQNANSPEEIKVPNVKYRTGHIFSAGLIERLYVTRETDKSIYYKTNYGVEERCIKVCSSHKIHETFEEAKLFLIDKSNTKIGNLVYRLSEEKTTLENLKQLTEKQ